MGIDLLKVYSRLQSTSTNIWTRERKIQTDGQDRLTLLQLLLPIPTIHCVILLSLSNNGHDQHDNKMEYWCLVETDAGETDW